ncbi:MAG: hypothetical protein V1901_03790 [Patescibacteria group bacterium]
MWVQYITAGAAVLSLGISLILKFNDMVHLPKEVAEIKKEVKDVSKQMNEINVKVTAISAICEERNCKKSKAR